MKLTWEYDEADLKRFADFVVEAEQRPFVQRRHSRNVLRSERVDLGKEEVWRVHLGCLLTTQQRSGAGSRVDRLLEATPFPLELRTCIAAGSAATLIQSTLQRWGGIRFAPTISKAAAANLTLLENGGWKQLENILQGLAAKYPSRDEERTAAKWLASHLKGIGPKQSRNLLQWLGLTRYEIPLDSRVIRWANNFGFPLRLSSGALSDEAYYCFVLDAIQHLCATVPIFPCQLDAMIFALDEPSTWRGGR